MTSADILQLANIEAERIGAMFEAGDRQALVLCYLAGRVGLFEEYSAALQAKSSIEKAKVVDAAKG